MPESREINLIPEEFLLREKAIRRIWVWGGVIGMVLVVLIGLFVVEKRNHGAVERVIAELNQKNQELKEKVAHLNVLQEKRNRLARKEKTVRALLYKRSLSTLLSEVETIMNRRVWLTSLEYDDPRGTARDGRFAEEDNPGTATGYFIIKDKESRQADKSEGPEDRAKLAFQGLGLSNRDIADFLESFSKSGTYTEVNLRNLQRRTHGDLHLMEFRMENYL